MWSGIICRVTPKLRRLVHFRLIFFFFFFFFEILQSSHIFWNSFKLYSHLVRNWQTVCLGNPKIERIEFFSSNRQGKIFLTLAQFLNAKLKCLLSTSEWCKKFTIRYLWWFTKSSLDHVCALPEISKHHRLVLIYCQWTVWVPILRALLCNVQWQKCIEWSCKKLWYCVCLPIQGCQVIMRKVCIHARKAVRRCIKNP